jgi:hypothetical protein
VNHNQSPYRIGVDYELTRSHGFGILSTSRNFEYWVKDVGMSKGTVT